MDYTDGSITENTRVSYPIDYIANIAKPSLGHNPKNVFFLTADAFGVLPPISKLTPGQAMYQFISGYTAKVAGTEMGVTEPQPSFSACFERPSFHSSTRRPCRNAWSQNAGNRSQCLVGEHRLVWRSLRGRRPDQIEVHPRHDHCSSELHRSKELPTSSIRFLACTFPPLAPKCLMSFWIRDKPGQTKTNTMMSHILPSASCQF